MPQPPLDTPRDPGLESAARIYDAFSQWLHARERLLAQLQANGGAGLHRPLREASNSLYRLTHELFPGVSPDLLETLTKTLMLWTCQSVAEKEPESEPAPAPKKSRNRT